jgi:ADP-heptose:LPS heptosyltransferase
VQHNELKESFNLYGAHCQRNRKYLAAKMAFKQALTFEPDNVTLWSNLGAVSHELFEFDQAKELLTKAIEKSPDYAAPYANYALVLNTINDHKKANWYSEKAISLDPECTLHHWNYALNMLDDGDWENGFKEYEWRKKHIPADYPNYKAPLWQGEDLSNKSIIVYEEQGIGDRILFSRFIFQLKQRYPTCKIYWMSINALLPLFWEYQKHDICEFIPLNVLLPETDYGVFEMSLPLLLKCFDPNNVPPDPGFIKDRCMAQKDTVKTTTYLPGGKRIGLCWHGSHSHAQDHMRSIPLEKLLPLINHPFYTWYSLQMPPDDAELEKLGAQDLIKDLSKNMDKENWVKTGVILLNMDLVITVDTAIAHLAGNLGVPVWLLVPKSSSWIWTRQGKTTAWYPNMTIFRQDKPMEWGPVIENVQKALDLCMNEITKAK